MGLEIIEQVPDVDAVIVPVGGGGLLAGVALAVKTLRPQTKIIAVEADHVASFSAALQARKPTSIPMEPTLADGLAIPQVGANGFEIARSRVDKTVTVTEEQIAVSILRIVELGKRRSGRSGRDALAACLSGQLSRARRKADCPSSLRRQYRSECTESRRSNAAWSPTAVSLDSPRSSAIAQAVSPI